MKKLAFLSTLLFIGTLSALVSTRLWALDLQTVVLKDISSSGKSILIDQGSLENLSEGAYASFFIQEGVSHPKIFFVAEGQLVKTFPKKSYWYLKKIYSPNAIKRDMKLLILTASVVNSGRSLKIKSKTVVRSKDDYKELQDFLDENKDNVPNRLVKEGENFESTADIFPENANRVAADPDVDVLLTNYETFMTKTGTYYSEEYGDLTKQRFFVDNVEVNLSDIKWVEEKKLLNSVSENYVKKTNDMKYGIKGFYADQEKLKEMPDIGRNGSNNSVYAEYKRQEKEATTIHPKVAAKFKRDGALWSADMDDATLRRYFIQTGLEKEIKRRELAINELDGHELIFHYSNAVRTHGNNEDPNYQGRGYNFGLAYDLHLSKVSPNLKNWSVQFFIEKEQNQYSTGYYNAHSSEFSYGIFVNYYFYNNPLTLDSFSYLVGLGFKSGNATLESTRLSKEYTYQVMSAPALQLMGKYRFRTGDLTEESINVGASFNFGINLDVKNLTTNQEIEDDIDGKFSVIDLKYTLGMSVFF
jgi:hypothetical protein